MACNTVGAKGEIVAYFLLTLGPGSWKNNQT